MKKDKFDMSNLGLPSKPQIIAPLGNNTQTILAKAVEDIHKSPEPVAIVVQTEPTPEPVKSTIDIKKVSMDLPLDLYKAVKYYSLESGVSMKDYIAQLIKADMDTRKAK
jgi:hypothetical protein